MKTPEKKFRIWNRETESYVSDTESGTHCCSEFAVKTNGEIIEIITDISTGYTSIQENPDYYFKGTKIVKEKKYELRD
jgi:hypothetical protein